MDFFRSAAQRWPGLADLRAMHKPNPRITPLLPTLAACIALCTACDPEDSATPASLGERLSTAQPDPVEDAPNNIAGFGPDGGFLYTGDFPADSGLAIGVERWSVYLHPENLSWVVIGRVGDEAVANLTIAADGDDLDVQLKYPFEARRQIVDGVVLEDSLASNPDAYQLVYAMGADISLGGQDAEPVNGKCYAAGGVAAGSCILGVAACAGVITCGAGAAVCVGGAWLALCECNPGQIVCQ